MKGSPSTVRKHHFQALPRFLRWASKTGTDPALPWPIGQTDVRGRSSFLFAVQALRVYQGFGTAETISYQAKAKAIRFVSRLVEDLIALFL
jgi:hypothetical protein